MDLLAYLLVFILLFHVVAGLEVAIGMGKIKSLKDVEEFGKRRTPSVCVIIAALNESKTIQWPLTSILSLDYSNLEVIVVDDRSTDETGDMLDVFARNCPKLQVYHITNLPQGWLGKTHALYFAAQRTKAEYLLFTDADVVMERTTVKRAVKYASENDVDHLTVIADGKSRGGLLNMVIVEWMGILFYPVLKPWKAKDPASNRYMGVGAFNFVRAEAYRKSGTHKAIAMCPVDDVMLGKLIKDHGFKQECFWGNGLIEIEWYPTLSALIRGTTKNTFAILDYQILKVIGITLMQFAVGILPLWVLIFSKGSTALIAALIVAVRLICFANGAGKAGIKPWYAIWSLISPYIYLYMLWRSTVLTLCKGGITWRGTFYPLQDLKAKKI